jgi:hypothetical protein
MIELHVEPYCQNCPEFDAEIGKVGFCLDSKVKEFNTYINCIHAVKCQRLLEYLRKEAQHE